MARPSAHQGERVIPESADFHRFAATRRDDPVIRLGIHPGKLDTLSARAEQAVGGVYLDAIARAAHMPVYDVIERGEELCEQGPVASYRAIPVERVEQPERRIYGVVFRRSVCAVWEAVGDHALAQEGDETTQQTTRLSVSAGGEGQAGKGDHSIASPVSEPGIARDNGHVLVMARAGHVQWRGPSTNDELVGRQCQPLDEGICGVTRAHEEVALTGALALERHLDDGLVIQTAWARSIG